MLEERGKRVGHKLGGMQERSQEGMFLPVLSSSPGDTRVSCEVRRHILLPEAWRETLQKSAHATAIFVFS